MRVCLLRLHLTLLLILGSLGSAFAQTPPTIDSHPVSQNVPVGSNAVFSVSASGVGPIHYVWKLNGNDLPDMTNTTLSILSAQLADEGNYLVDVSNAFGTTSSSNAFLNVVTLPEALNATNLVWITSSNQPWFPDTGVSHDGVASGSGGLTDYLEQIPLETTVFGPGKLEFWWRADRESGSGYFRFLIDGDFQASYLTTGWEKLIYDLGEGQHSLEWYTVGGSWPFITGWLDQVGFIPGGTVPTLVVSPADVVAPAGTNTVFSAVAEGTPPLSYQWQFNGTNLSGATSASLSLANVQAGDAGTYSVLVSNLYGFTNASATLSVNATEPSILAHPSDQEMVRGGTVSFSAVARGSEPLVYQWQFDEGDIPDETNSVLILSHIQTEDVGSYRLNVSNAYGTNLSTSATLMIVPSVIVAWGTVPNYLQPPRGLTNVTAISGGDNYSLALIEDGTVRAWGVDSFSRLDVPVTLSNVVIISAGGLHGSSLKSDGTVVNWGNSFFDPAVIVPPNLSNVVDVAAGERFNLALKQDGTAVSWGASYLDPLNMPSGLSNIVDLGAGEDHGLALMADGSVIAWGYNNFGQTNVPASSTDVVEVAGGEYYSMALKRDASVVVWGDPSVTNVPPSATNVVSISAGARHCLALKRDGTVVSWGTNVFGQIDVPSWLTNVVAVAGGRTHSLVLLNDGSPYVVRQPWTQTVYSGEPVEFRLVALGHPPLSYQWRFNENDILGATNASVVVTNAALTAAGHYRCVVSNSVGSNISIPAELTVLRSAPEFLRELSGFNGDGGFDLFLTGLSGHGEIVLYGSTNLVDWLPILTNPPVLGDLKFTDWSATNWTERFYWVQEQ